jgi:hypothetical protein
MGRRAEWVRKMRIYNLVMMAALAALVTPALGEDGGSGTGEIKLGSIRRFADETSARAACSPDGVVWADDKTGFFYPKFHPDYGKSRHGAYTCYHEAEKADYWSLTPGSDDSRKGREFPLFFCYGCS